MPTTRFFGFAVIIDVTGRKVVPVCHAVIQRRRTAFAENVEVEYLLVSRIACAATELPYVRRKRVAYDYDFKFETLSEIVVSSRSAVRTCVIEIRYAFHRNVFEIGTTPEYAAFEAYDIVVENNFSDFGFISERSAGDIFYVGFAVFTVVPPTEYADGFAVSAVPAYVINAVSRAVLIDNARRVLFAADRANAVDEVVIPCGSFYNAVVVYPSSANVEIAFIEDYTA